MQCCQPSLEFLRVFVDHPRIPIEDKEAMRRQIACLEEEEDTMQYNPEACYLSPNATESSECESPLKRRAERSPGGEPRSPKNVHLRGGGGTPVKPRWRIYDHENAITGRNLKADDKQLPGALRRDEHDPPVTIADDASASAKALYETTEKVVEFFKTAFGHEIGVGDKPLVASYHYGMNEIGGAWKPKRSQAVFGDGTRVFNNAAHCSDLVTHELAHGIILRMLGFRTGLISAPNTSRVGDEGSALWEHFADFVALLKMMYDDNSASNYLIGASFFHPSLGCLALRNALNPGHAWRYIHDDGKLRSDSGVGHVCKQHTAVTYYDVSLIPTRAFVLFSQKIDYKTAGQIWWLTIKSLKLNGEESLMITISEFAKQTLRAAIDLNLQNTRNPLLESWAMVGIVNV